MPAPKTEIKPVLLWEIAEHEKDGWVPVNRRLAPCGIVYTIPVTHRQGDWPSILMRKEDKC